MSKGFFNGLKAYCRKLRSDIYNIDPTIISHQPLYKREDLSNSSKNNNINIEIDLSPELYTPLSDLAHFLTFLSNHVPTRFSEMGGRQFEIDMVKGLFTLEKDGFRNQKIILEGMNSLKDACVLLTVPSSHQTIPVTKQNNSIQQKTLSQVMRVLFDDDLEVAEVHKMLENLCVFHLSQKKQKMLLEEGSNVGKDYF
ncbi:rint1 family protein [Gigaspora margarita]|uniref:Rint1 family protein n=1 Tax=Gigaspora margarita TaxID=4874 RepID=A0A8H3ZYX0_GIGMA|nr:rint1 family protein [Gigaspora margarita]